MSVDTYIIDPYKLSVRIIDLLFLTPLMLCVLILYISGGKYSLKSTPNDKFLGNFSWQFYFIYCQSFCQKSAES